MLLWLLKLHVHVTSFEEPEMFLFFNLVTEKWFKIKQIILEFSAAADAAAFVGFRVNGEL